MKHVQDDSKDGTERSLATVNLAYDQDIHITQETREAYPRLCPLFDFVPLRERFDDANVCATKCKAKYVLCGRLSICTALLALFGTAAELVISGYGMNLGYPGISLLFEILAALSLLTLLFMHLKRFRDRWLEACFERERIRHWWWQCFLDGPLVEEALGSTSNSLDGTAFRNKWAKFASQFTTNSTSPTQYKARRPRIEDMYFTRRDYTDSKIAKDVFEFLKDLRFDHQINYPNRAKGLVTTDKRVNLEEHREWVDTFARAALVCALLFPFSHLGYFAAENVFEDLPMLGSGSHTLFGVLALFAAVASGIARAYLSGLTLPEEAEAYEDYAAHVHTLSEIFILAKNAESKQRVHRNLELEAERELRRFLVMKSKASFVA